MWLELGEIPQDGPEGRPLDGGVVQALTDEGGQLLAGRLGQAMSLLIETFFLRERKEKQVSNGARSILEWGMEREEKASHLRRSALLEWDISVKADFQQCGAKAPFVSRSAEVSHIPDAFRGDPGDPVHALFGRGKAK